MMSEEQFGGGIYEGEPDAVKRDVDGKQDDLEEGDDDDTA